MTATRPRVTRANMAREALEVTAWRLRVRPTGDVARLAERLSGELARFDLDAADRTAGELAPLLRLKEEKPPLPADQRTSLAHLYDGLGTNLRHAMAHAERLADSKVDADPASRAFHLEHVLHHGRESVDHHDRLGDALKSTASDPAQFKKDLAAVAPAGGNGKQGTKSGDLDGLHYRRRHQAQPSEFAVSVTSFRGGSASLSFRARDLILQTARMNRGVEVGGLLFGDSASRDCPRVSEASEPGPGASCSPWAFMVDLEHDQALIELMAGRGLVEVGSWHSHVDASAPPDQLDQPSTADLDRWALLRSGRSYLGVIVRTPPSPTMTPRLHAWVVKDSSTGVASIAEPVRLRVI